MPSSPAALELLAATRYLLVTTFRRDGTAVPTPVWAARLDGELVLSTAPDAGKVKRVRRNPTVTVAPSSVRGKALGRTVDARARILDPAEHDAAAAVLARKYGWQWAIYVLPYRIRGRRPGFGYLAIHLTD